MLIRYFIYTEPKAQTRPPCQTQHCCDIVVLKAWDWTAQLKHTANIPLHSLVLTADMIPLCSAPGLMTASVSSGGKKKPISLSASSELPLPWSWLMLELAQENCARRLHQKHTQSPLTITHLLYINMIWYTTTHWFEQMREMSYTSVYLSGCSFLAWMGSLGPRLFLQCSTARSFTSANANTGPLWTTAETRHDTL